MTRRHEPDFARDLRSVMRRARVCALDEIRNGWKLVIVGESPPPKQTEIAKTSIHRMVCWSRNPHLLAEPFVFLANVNAVNPGPRGRGSKAPKSREATVAAYSILNLLLTNRELVIREDASVVFLLLGRAAIAFRMYDGHDPGKYPPYCLYRIPRIVREYRDFPCYVDRYIVRIPHPIKLTSKISRERVGRLLSLFI